MARWTVLIYGVINVLGGVMGYVASQSVMSLIAGGAAGLILIALGVIAPKKPAMAYRTAGVVTLALVGFWAYRISTVAPDKRMMPTMNLVLALGVLGLLAMAHFMGVKKAASQPE